MTDPRGDLPPAYREALALLRSRPGAEGGPVPRRTPRERWAHWQGRLERTRRLLEALGSPQTRSPVLLVAGTSGKGSTALLLAAGLAGAGLRVGLHTSPYLQVATEKLVVDGRPLAPEAFLAAVRSLAPALAAVDPIDPPTYGETWVGLTYQAFAQEGVDAAVVEVGVGGRFDPTNAADPVGVAVTRIALDHRESLSPSRLGIAWHKAGVIRPGIPAVTATRGRAGTVLAAEAAGKGARLLGLGREFALEGVEATAGGTALAFRGRRWRLRLRLRGLLGRHQAENAALALALLEALADRWGLDPARVAAGMEEARLPGRLEVVAARPTVVLDGAHNPDKGRALARALAELWPDRRPLLVFGALAGKDWRRTLVPLLEGAAFLAAVPAPVTWKPVADPEGIAAFARRRGVEARAFPDPEAGLAAALERAGSGDLVVVTGSLYLVGRLRERWVPSGRVLAGLDPWF